jgi:hypothetical protein
MQQSNETVTTARISLLSVSGRVLAETSLPKGATAGEHGETREFPIDAEILISSQVSHCVLTTPAGQVAEIPVEPFYVMKGKRVRGKVRFELSAAADHR